MRIPFNAITMIGAVTKIPGVAFPLFGVTDFKCSVAGSRSCLEVANNGGKVLAGFGFGSSEVAIFFL